MTKSNISLIIILITLVNAGLGYLNIASLTSGRTMSVTVIPEGYSTVAGKSDDLTAMLAAYDVQHGQ